jgi:hypothetical protein
MEAHRGRVVVQFVEFDGELAKGVGDDRQGQGSDVGIEQRIETPAHAVISRMGKAPRR